MSSAGKVHKIDFGRLIVVPFFTFFVVFSLSTVWRDARALSPVNTIKCLVLMHHVLSVCFCALIIFLYFIRRPAILTGRSFVTNSIAIVASFGPFFTLLFLGKPSLTTQGMLLVADLIITIGMVLSIYSIYSLGKSFSIIPQARKLVQSGPYRLVRHPIYLGELISIFGVILTGLTIPKLIMYLLLIGCQVYRALQEEKLLAGVFPQEYEEYSSRTARFIPGII